MKPRLLAVLGSLWPITPQRRDWILCAGQRGGLDPAAGHSQFLAVLCRPPTGAPTPGRRLGEGCEQSDKLRDHSCCIVRHVVMLNCRIVIISMHDIIPLFQEKLHWTYFKILSFLQIKISILTPPYGRDLFLLEIFRRNWQDVVYYVALLLCGYKLWLELFCPDDGRRVGGL